MLQYRILRFAAVGIINTSINFLILNFSFYRLGLGKIAANVVATSVALIISFVLNREFVFIHRGHWIKQFLTFALVTAIGTLVINNAVYILALSVLKGHFSYDVSNWLRDAGIKLSRDFIEINCSALIATVFSMVWNYTGYRKVVFREAKTDEAE